MTRIAIVGASARAAAFSALRAGMRPVAADLFADVDLQRVCRAERIHAYPQGVTQWLTSANVDGWMYTGAMENHASLVDLWAGIYPLWGNPGEVLRQVRSPWRVAEALRAADLLFPNTRRIADGLPVDGSWLVKTYRGSSGSGVRPLCNRAAFQPSADGGAVLQQRVNGMPLSAVFVAAAGRAELLGVTRQLVGAAWAAAQEFQYAGSIGPCPDNQIDLAAVARIGGVLAERFLLTGIFGVDMIVNEHGVWTLEVNPRYTASVEILERATGLNAIAAHVAACTGHSVPTIYPTQYSGSLVGKAILFARQAVTISGKFTAWAMEQNDSAIWPVCADIPADRTRIDAGRPVMTLFATGDNATLVEQRLRMLAADVEARLLGQPGSDG